MWSVAFRSFSSFLVFPFLPFFFSLLFFLFFSSFPPLSPFFFSLFFLFFSSLPSPFLLFPHGLLIGSWSFRLFGLVNFPNGAKVV